MAFVLDEEEAKKIRQQNQKKITDKRAKQHAQGKDLVLDEDGHHSGVMPEAVWKNLPGRSIEDPEAIR